MVHTIDPPDSVTDNVTDSATVSVTAGVTANVGCADTAGRDGTPADTAQAIVVTLIRTVRALKRTPGTLEPGQLFVLHAVAAHGPLRLSDLAAHVHLDPSTVSRHVRTLEDAGRLSRSTDPGDRRATQLTVTAGGLALLSEGFDRMRERVRSALADWPAGDLAALSRLLARFAHDLDPDTEPRT